MSFGLKNAGATYQRLVNHMFKDQIWRNIEVFVDDMLVKSPRANTHLADIMETFNILDHYNMKLNPTKCAFGVSSGKFLGFLISYRGIEANLEKIQAILQLKPRGTKREVQRLIGKVISLSQFISRSTDKCLPFFATLRSNFKWNSECATTFKQLKTYLRNPPLLSRPV